MEKITSIVLCAGEGTRAKNISENIPKPLIKVTSLGNQTILSTIISNLKKLKFDPIILVTGHLSKQIEDYVKLPQIKTQFGEENLLIHNSGLEYKLGPLFSFLSITNNNQIFKEEKIYTVFPGDTVFDCELLREIINKLLENYSQIVQSSILFYRKIRTDILINQFNKQYPNLDKTISHLEIDETGSKPNIKEIIQNKLSTISKEREINQVIPIFIFNMSYVKIIKELASPDRFRSIREVVNEMMKKKEEFIAVEVSPEFNFYDIDTHLDLKILNEKKKKDGQ
jgi:NDP-sugar pyrophosphorylase family protein